MQATVGSLIKLRAFFETSRRLLKKMGDPVRRGEPLYRVHAGIEAELNFARRLADADSGYRNGAGPE